MSHPIQSEAHLTTFEAISMIVGNSIGTASLPFRILPRRTVCWMSCGWY